MKILNYRRGSWKATLDAIYAAGFTTGQIAKRIRSTHPTVRAIHADRTEPKHSQGMYLINMCKAVKAGILRPEEK